MGMLPAHWGTIIDKAYNVLTNETIAKMFYFLQGAEAFKHSNEAHNIDDVLALTAILSRLVENDVMRAYERRFEELYYNDDTLIKDLLILVVEVLDLVIELHDNGELLIWQPLEEVETVNGK